MHAGRASRAELTELILSVLARLGGTAACARVIDEVGQALHLSKEDRQCVGDGGEERWRNDVRWAREDLVREGLLLRPSHSGSGVWSLSANGRARVPARESEPVRWAPVLPGILGGQFGDWSKCFLSASRAQGRSGSNTTLADIIDVVERRLMALSPSRTVRAPEPCGPSVGPIPTIRAGPRAGGQWGSFADPDPLGSFVMRWEGYIGRISKAPGRDLADQVQLVDEATGLALLLCLLAASKGWVDRIAAARIAAKITRHSLGEVDFPRGALGDLLLKVSQSPARSGSRGLLRFGLAHRALTAWVQLLDKDNHPGARLFVAVLRARADRIRRALGEVHTWGTGGLPWGGLVEDCADLPAPDEEESLVNELEHWIRTNPLPVVDRTPEPGTLLWKPSVGWGLTVGRIYLGRKGLFTVALVAEGSTLPVKPERTVGWMIVAEQSVPDTLKPARALTLDLVRASTGRPPPDGAGTTGSGSVAR